MSLGSRLGRVLPLLVGVVLASASTLFGAYWLLERYEIQTPTIGLDAAKQTALTLHALSYKGETEWDVVFVGDSTAMAVPNSQSVPKQLQRAMAPVDRRAVRIHSLTFPGFSPFDLYFQSGDLVRANPDAVVILINPRALNPNFPNRPLFAGFLDASRWTDLLHIRPQWTGLRADQLLLYRAIVLQELAPQWRWLLAQQARVGTARKQWFAELEQADPLRLARFSRTRDRARSAEGLRFAYAKILKGVDADYPPVLALEATVAHLSEAGIPSVVYLAPLDIESLAQRGIHEEAGLEASVATFRNAVESAGGRFVDLLTILPAESFHDEQGHYAIDAEVLGSEEIARRVAPVLSEVLRKSRSAR